MSEIIVQYLGLSAVLNRTEHRHVKAWQVLWNEMKLEKNVSRKFFEKAALSSKNNEMSNYQAKLYWNAME